MFKFDFLLPLKTESYAHKLFSRPLNNVFLKLKCVTLTAVLFYWTSSVFNACDSFLTISTTYKRAGVVVEHSVKLTLTASF